MFINKNVSIVIILLATGILFSYSLVILEVNAQSIVPHGMITDNETGSTTISNNFTVYQNLDMGFQIQYPVQWEAIEKKSPSAIDTVEFVPPTSQMDDSSNNIFFTVSRENISKGLSVNLDSITERNTNLAKSLPNFTSIESNKTNLGGLPAYKIKYNFTSPSVGSKMVFQTLNVWTISDDKMYTISYTATNSYLLTYNKIIERMIDTFKVVK